MPAGSAMCIPEGMLGSTIRNARLKGESEASFCTFSLRNQFLHPNHPLGWIRSLRLSVNGVSAPQADIFFVLRGQWIAAQHLPTIADIWWQMRETVEIFVRRNALAQGKHLVELSIEVSMFAHTPAIDTLNTWPTRHQTLVQEMELVT